MSWPALEDWRPVMSTFGRRGLVLATGSPYRKGLCQSQTKHGTHGDQVQPSLSITWGRGKVHAVIFSAAPTPPLPRYGTRSLGELVPSLLGCLGVAGFANPLAIEPAARACLLMVVGLGWEQLRANAGAAPFLNSLAREPLTAGFPATTAASLSSLSTGMRIHHLGPAFHEWSGLTRAIGRGERFHPADSLETVTEGALRLLNASRTFVFGYHPRLDAAGHVHGVASQAWSDELTAVDHAVRLLAEQLPADTQLVVSGDHGMVDLRPGEKLDLADHPDLAAGVRILGGEARARYVGAVQGATDDVLGAWRSRLGDRMWIWPTEQAIATGIFGPRVNERARERMGDIVAAAYGRVGIVERNVDPAQARDDDEDACAVSGASRNQNQDEEDDGEREKANKDEGDAAVSQPAAARHFRFVGSPGLIRQLLAPALVVDQRTECQQDDRKYGDDRPGIDRHRDEVKADVNDLEERERRREPQIALHVANQIAAGRAIVRSQGGGARVGLDGLLVLVLLLQRDAEVIPGGRVVG